MSTPRSSCLWFHFCDRKIWMEESPGLINSPYVTSMKMVIYVFTELSPRLENVGALGWR